ncbi:GT2 family glycosyltransferase/glycosyltransferase involved in cell wall biosynthesis [Cryobacterium sp. CAN_C3]|uniref:glycosyltransferase n=1 Tax=unclassified Cryobacterium TaxID=2649013 RepID=UPI0018CA2A1E|nr:glycosyltransferase [Cryobacterium sp. CAN_C3]MEC5155343.1 GT2 family glycosyltransferase/glycosyltransferase involved in cell wall biosynthesis [Cryobacterium sp. CAN_C3]
MDKKRLGVVSVVLVNFRGADDTLECIEGLFGLNWPHDRLEIVVVENGSGDDSLEKLRAVSDRIVLVKSESNRGFTGGCNLGVENSTGEFVAFLNNDAKPHPDWISEAVATFAQGVDIGAVASKVLDWDGVNVDYVDASITWYGMGYKPHAGEKDGGSWDEEKDVLFGTGAAMFIKATVFKELGGFDDNFFMFYDDVDLGWRLNLLGYRFRYQPKSLAFHKHHASMNKFGNFREEYLLERNALYSLYKNLDDEGLARVLPGALLLATRRAIGRGKLDSTALDIRVLGDDSEPTMAVPKSTMAGVFAIDQFVELLPQMTAARAHVQSTRVRTDRDMARLFGNIDEPAYPIESYLRGYDKIVDSLNVLATTPRRRILVITGDSVGTKMAGPAIRAWNIAKLLSGEHDVRLLSMTKAESLDDSFEVGVISHHRPSSVMAHEHWADVIIVQGHALALFPALETSTKVLVVDVYDPLHLEQLEQGRGKVLELWNKQVNDATDALNHQLLIGDFFLCASERQRHFWLGQLAGLGRINAYTYSRDSELDSLIAIAPFGISSTDPEQTRPAIRGVIPGIGADDKVIVWGGGIYNWFDPSTLIRAVAEVSVIHPDVRLLFMGVKHPNPDVPEMEAVSEARVLSEQLGMTNKHVFFNESWVPYDERQNYLLEADLGVSTHFQHVETTFSFRTRILDYLWAGLPIVTTGGDSFGDLVEKEKLGASIPERDQDALVAALQTYLYDAEAISEARKNVQRVREGFLWERALAPLVEFCRQPLFAADKKLATNLSGPRGRTKPIQTVLRTRHTGIRRDIDRVMYYFREGGAGAVLERFQARQERKRDS